MVSPTSYTGDSYGMVMGSLRGYRVWAFDVPQSRLLSLNGVIWPSRELTASCHYTTLLLGSIAHSSSSPNKQCTCGIYACHTPTNSDFQTLLFGGGGFRIPGVVEGFGRIVVGRSGFRCEKMRIVGLVVPQSSYRENAWHITQVDQSSSFWQPGAIDVHVTVAFHSGETIRIPLHFSPVAMEQATSMDALLLAEVQNWIERWRGILRFDQQGLIESVTSGAYQGVKLFDTTQEMFDAYPPISVEHLLPRTEKKIPVYGGGISSVVSTTRPPGTIMSGTTMWGINTSQAHAALGSVISAGQSATTSDDLQKAAQAFIDMSKSMTMDAEKLRVDAEKLAADWKKISQRDLFKDFFKRK